MRDTTHPVLMVDSWLKAASDLQRPSGVSDVKRRQSTIGKDRPAYAQPNPPAATTRPDTIANQKALSPPPVM